MKKGFTLVELLAILALLGVVIIVGVPALIDSNRKSENMKQNEFDKKIQIACEEYATIEKVNENKTIKVGDLVNNKYLDASTEVPGGNRKISDDGDKNITIEINSGVVRCSYPY